MAESGVKQGVFGSFLSTTTAGRGRPSTPVEYGRRRNSDASIDGSDQAAEKIKVSKNEI
jgi:hypothetical protein